MRGGQLNQWYYEAGKGEEDNNFEDVFSSLSYKNTLLFRALPNDDDKKWRLIIQLKRWPYTQREKEPWNMAVCSFPAWQLMQ